MPQRLYQSTILDLLPQVYQFNAKSFQFIYSTKGNIGPFSSFRDLLHCQLLFSKIETNLQCFKFKFHPIGVTK